MLDNKKAQTINKKIEAAAIIVIIVIVLFSLFSSLIPEAQTAAEQLNVSNRCSAVGCFFNATDNANTSVTADCRTNSSIVALECGDPLGAGIPLSSLFGTQGIVFLLLMVGLLLIILRTVMSTKKK